MCTVTLNKKLIYLITPENTYNLPTDSIYICTLTPSEIPVSSRFFEFWDHHPLVMFTDLLSWGGGKDIHSSNVKPKY